jgi:hypothetical protein
MPNRKIEIFEVKHILSFVIHNCELDAPKSALNIGGDTSSSKLHQGGGSRAAVGLVYKT